MNGRYTIERSRRPMGIAARGGQWLLPWVSVLVASATIAYAAEQALVGSSGWARPAQQDGRAPPVASASTSRSTVNLSSVDGDGKRMSVVCLTNPDRASA